LRAALRLQSGSDNLFSVACSLGYSDGFALSNQMYRLTGVRPSATRDHYGWEWLVERWLEREGTRDLSKAALDSDTEEFASRATVPEERAHPSAVPAAAAAS